MLRFIGWILVILASAFGLVWLIKKKTKTKLIQTLRSPEEIFTIPKRQRIDISIQTLEQILEETDDETIRQAITDRLKQLKTEPYKKERK